jgi:hypothetical protein
LHTANALGRVLHGLGDQTAARAVLEDTLTRRQRALGRDHPDTVETADLLVVVLGKLDAQSAASDS